MSDGKKLTAENEFPRGHDQDPMSDDEVTAKFCRTTAGLIDEPTQNKILDLCWKLEELDSVTKLLALFPTGRSND